MLSLPRIIQPITAAKIYIVIWKTGVLQESNQPGKSLRCRRKNPCIGQLVLVGPGSSGFDNFDKNPDQNDSSEYAEKRLNGQFHRDCDGGNFNR